MQQYFYYGGLDNADYVKNALNATPMSGDGMPFRTDLKLMPHWTNMSGGSIMRVGGLRERAPVRTQPVRAKAAPVENKSLWQRAKTFIKDNKYISRGLGELADLAGKYKTFEKYKPYLAAGQTAASLSGWGKRKRGKNKKYRRK